MSKLANRFLSTRALAGAAVLALSIAQVSVAQTLNKYPGLGRPATPAELAAWDIDVRPDFKGLPKGSGTVERGQEIWESRCANCHGTFGESNEVFTPIIGGTTVDDIKTGRVASLTDPKQPQRTTLMKVATLSSLYDYIYRAMPWNAPRSMSADDTYAALAYMLSIAEIVPDDFELSDKNMPAVQQRMPNRNGMTTAHGMWNMNGKPDVTGSSCMNNCQTEVKVTSFLPDYARNAHNNIADQNRIFGPFRGTDSNHPPVDKLPGVTYVVMAAPPIAGASSIATSIAQDLFKKNACNACHAPASKLVGPSIAEIAAKYKAQPDVMPKLVAKVKQGGAGVWGTIPMMSHPDMSDGDIGLIVNWMLTTP